MGVYLTYDRISIWSRKIYEFLYKILNILMLFLFVKLYSLKNISPLYKFIFILRIFHHYSTFRKKYISYLTWQLKLLNILWMGNLCLIVKLYFLLQSKIVVIKITSDFEIKWIESILKIHDLIPLVHDAISIQPWVFNALALWDGSLKRQWIWYQR